MRHDLITMYFKARDKVIRTRYSQYAEDFAAWLMIKYLEGKSLRQLLRFSFYDFLREELEPVRKLNQSLSLIPEEVSQYSPEDCAILFDLIKKHATPLEEKLLYLYLIEGMHLKEIAESYGIHESRVSQRFTALAKRCGKRRTDKKPKDSIRG